MKRYWFKRGKGITGHNAIPTTWQGWLTFVIFIAIIAITISLTLVGPAVYPRDISTFLAIFIISTTIFYFIVWKKTKPY